MDTIIDSKEKNYSFVKELLHKAGMESSNEYRQHLIDEDQYKQWQTIYKQSQVQLDLLAPDAENKDLFYRRLRRQ